MFLVIIDPKRIVIDNLEKSRDEFELVRAHGENLRETKAELISRFNSIPSEEVDRLRQFLPDTVDNVRLLVDVDAIAKRKQIVISNISIDTEEATAEEEEVGEIGKVSISFTFISEYNVMKEILAELEQSLRVVDVRAIEVSVAPESSSFATTLTIDTYWLR